MKNIVLLTNILTPYRQVFYNAYYEECKKYNIDFHVLCMAETEPERNWYYNEFSSDHTTLMEGKTSFYFGVMTHDNPKVMDYILQHNPDVLLVGGSYMFLSLWRVVLNKKKLHCPVIYWNESHKNSVRTYNSLSLFVREMIRKWFFKKIDGFWYGGKMAKAFVEDYAMKKAKYYFMPNLIENEAFNVVASTSYEEKQQIRRAFNINMGQTVFICPARLTLVKGIHTFMDLLKKVENKQDCVVLIPGDGDMEDDLKRQAKTIDADIRFIGYKQQSEIITLYKIADIFLMPSLSDPNPLTCIEALWCGLPLLVSTHVGNYPEVIRIGKNGFVFDYSKPEEAVNIISQVIASSSEWRTNAKKVSLDIATIVYNPKNVIDRSIKELIKDWGQR